MAAEPRGDSANPGGHGGGAAAVALAAACTTTAGSGATATTSPAANTTNSAVAGPRHWVSTWAASPMAATPSPLTSAGDLSAAGLRDQTIRDVVWASAGGRAARIRLSNVFGTRPVTFSQLDIGVSAGGAAVAAGTNHPITFAGHAAVTIKPGAEAVSDPVRLNVPAETNLVVSLFTAAATGPATYHADAQQANYLAAGNHAGRDSASPFTTTNGAWFFLDDVDVRAATSGAVVALGDSITDGYQSTVGANARWPNDLARRFRAAGQALPVVDEGISGNRLLNGSACSGQSALTRFSRDVAGRNGARYVILLEGINDIGYSRDPNSGCTAPNTNVSAAQIIAGYQRVIAAAHAAGLMIFGATMTPFQGSDYYSAAGETETRDGQPLDPHQRCLRRRHRLRPGRPRPGRPAEAGPRLRQRRPPAPQRRRLPGHGQPDQPHHVQGPNRPSAPRALPSTRPRPAPSAYAAPTLLPP